MGVIVAGITVGLCAFFLCQSCPDLSGVIFLPFLRNMLEIAQVRKSIRLVCQRLTTTRSDITLNLREGGPYPCLQWGGESEVKTSRR